MITRPMNHTETTFSQCTVARTPSPWFAPPVPSYMREPGTNYVTIITSEGPQVYVVS